MSEYLKVESMDHLKVLCEDEPKDFFISLNLGFRSSKQITWHPEEEQFGIYNEIDDTDQELKEKELFTESNIGEALEKGALYMY